MQIKIIEKHFGGVEFTPEMRVLHLGGQSSANVEWLEFQLPESWQGKSVTLHIQRQDGTMPSPILLDENNSCAVGKEFTASPCGQWMLLALGEDGFRALTRPAKYDCYETLATDGDAEISRRSTRPLWRRWWAIQMLHRTVRRKPEMRQRRQSRMRTRRKRQGWRLQQQRPRPERRRVRRKAARAAQKGRLPGQS